MDCYYLTQKKYSVVHGHNVWLHVISLSFLGKEGICVTDLRPAGTITVAGEPVDVVAEGSFVKQGDTVKVISVDGSRVLVRPL